MCEKVDIDPRQELQAEAFKTLVEHKRVICNWGTGVGKSRVAINFVDYLDIIEEKHKILLLVAESTHKQNWKKEFYEMLGKERSDELLQNIRIECYASLKKCTDQHWDFIIADEGHHLRSDKRIELLKYMDAENVLVLSATLSERGDGDDLLKALNKVFGDFITLKFEIQQAIDNGILPEPRIEVIALEMWDKAEDRYDSISEYLERKKKEYIAATRDTGFFAKSEEELEEMKARMLHAGSMRKQFLGRLKTKMARRILDEYERKGLRYICFCASIDQVQKLGGVNVINSKQSKKTNKAVIDSFNNGEINSLFAVGMLQEGVSLVNIQAGLIVQLDGKARAFVQKFGRVMRSKEPLLKIIYVPESRDEDFLYNALKGVKKEYINGWDITKYEQTHALLSIKEISGYTLVGPPASYANIRTKFYTEPVETRGYGFVAFNNGMTIQKGNILQGTFCGIMVDPAREHIYLNIYNKTQQTFYALRSGWKGSLGLLMPLITAPKLYHEDIIIKLTPDGQYTKSTIWIASQELSWSKLQIPKDEPGEQGNPRLNFINNLIAAINDKYTREKNLAQPQRNAPQLPPFPSIPQMQPRYNPNTQYTQHNLF